MEASMDSQVCGGWVPSGSQSIHNLVHNLVHIGWEGIATPSQGVGAVRLCATPSAD
jgi:hypothetical protein